MWIYIVYKNNKWHLTHENSLYKFLGQRVHKLIPLECSVGGKCMDRMEQRTNAFIVEELKIPTMLSYICDVHRSRDCGKLPVKWSKKATNTSFYKITIHKIMTLSHEKQWERQTDRQSGYIELH